MAADIIPVVHQRPFLIAPTRGRFELCLLAIIMCVNVCKCLTCGERSGGSISDAGTHLLHLQVIAVVQRLIQVATRDDLRTPAWYISCSIMHARGMVVECVNGMKSAG